MQNSESTEYDKRKKRASIAISELAEKASGGFWIKRSDLRTTETNKR